MKIYKNDTKSSHLHYSYIRTDDSCDVVIIYLDNTKFQSGNNPKKVRSNYNWINCLVNSAGGFNAL